ncbi:putative urea ABC transporter substrate-binding protein [Flavobacterium sp. 7A]|uniref:putative urea ABC transporter substrate-binding protein n=1 Tax=Flavobacterium sp. 7A TaxID=2940571 RepID=UPI00222722B3|nr:putative urea ABC transporter substrate-binding protein [Flavobacterium sp. 7A]MCW2119332.1 NitT/TauT family transport system substrate-binding protein [Flavobacterium sp. 7A]
MKKLNSVTRVIVFLLIVSLTVACGKGDKKDSSGLESKKKTFKIAWSIYSGWQPWDYANQSKILKKWGEKYGIEIELIKMDYIASIEAYVAGQVDGCVMTNMEALDMPASAGIASTAIILGDYSNGNDALLTRDNLQIEDLMGKEVNLVELSVSHYLFSRALDKKGMKESDVKIVNTSDSDIAPAFISNKELKAVVTWNPLVMKIKEEKDVKQIFSSASIPGEIIDLMVVNTDVLNANPEIGNALVGTWYEVMGIMKQENKTADDALTIMAESGGSTLQEYKDQLKTTALFYTSKSAINYVKSKEIVKNMDYIRKFCFSHGLLGENASSFDQVGIQYPDGSVQGDKNNIKLYFDASYMEKVANDKL